MIHVYHRFNRSVANPGDRRHDHDRGPTPDKPGAVHPVRRFVPSLDPKRSIEGAILNGFADVLGGDGI